MAISRNGKDIRSILTNECLSVVLAVLELELLDLGVLFPLEEIVEGLDADLADQLVGGFDGLAGFL